MNHDCAFVCTVSTDLSAAQVSEYLAKTLWEKCRCIQVHLYSARRVLANQNTLSRHNYSLSIDNNYCNNRMVANSSTLYRIDLGVDRVSKYLAKNPVGKIVGVLRFTYILLGVWTSQNTSSKLLSHQQVTTLSGRALPLSEQYCDWVTAGIGTLFCVSLSLNPLAFEVQATIVLLSCPGQNLLLFQVKTLFPSDSGNVLLRL